MVNRFQRKEIAVFDLDGTLLRINSYKLFLITWFAWLVLSLNIKVIKCLLSTIIQRQKKTLNRVSAKQAILELYLENRNKYYEKQLVRLLYLFRRFSIMNRLKELQDSHDIILATAAYCFYTLPLASKFHVHKVICTSLEDMKKGNECIGEEKVTRLKSIYGIDKIKYLYTDHSDDLPLIKNSKNSFIVNPSKKSKLKICNELNYSKSKIHFI